MSPDNHPISRQRWRSAVAGRSLLRLLAIAAIVPGQQAVSPEVFAQAPPSGTGTGRARTDVYGDPLPAGAIARMGTMRFWTGLDIRSICFAPDGKTLASRSMGYLAMGTAVWEANGRLIRTLQPAEGGRDEIGEMAFSPDGRSLAGCDAGAVVIWDVATGRIIRVLQCEDEDELYPRQLHGPAFAARSGAFAACAGDTVRVWDPATGAEIRRLKGAARYVSSIALSPDGDILAAGSAHGGIKLWDVGTGKVRDELPDLKGVRVNGFSLDGKTLTTVSGGGVTVWDLAAHREVRRVVLEATKPVPVVGERKPAPVVEARKFDLEIDDRKPPLRYHSVLSRDGAILAVADVGGSISIWQTGTGRLSRRIQVEPAEASACLALSHDGKTVASTSGYTSLRLWDVASGQEVGPYHRHLGPVRSIARSRDQSMLASAGEDYTIRLCDAMTGKEIRSIRDGPPEIWRSRDIQDEPRIQAIGPTGQIAFSGDDKAVISPCCDGTVRFWDVGSGQESRRIRLEGTETLAAIAFAPTAARWPRWPTVHSGCGTWRRASASVRRPRTTP